MKYLIVLSAFFFSLLLSTHAQEQDPNLLFDPDEILIQGEPVPEVLLVGSFHFAYYGADAHVTKDEDKVDVLHPSKQAEVRELVSYIARFKPNKIAVEGGRNSGYILRRYEQYLEDSTSLIANEIDQIAFRLMKQFELDTLYGVDSYGIVGDLYDSPDSTVLRPIIDSIYQDWDFQNDEEISLRYDSLYSYGDQITSKESILRTFRHMNADKVLDRGWGAYLVGDFKNGSYEGADALAMHWYARNLRIFRNIQNITDKDDRILVLFGAGHMTILKYLFQCSPEYKLVKFNSVE